MLQRCAEQVFHLAGIGVADGLAPLAAQGRLDQVWVADSPLQRPRSPAELRAEGSLVGKTPSSACVQDGTARPRGRCVLRLPPPQFAAAALENPGARDGGEDLARRRAGQRRPGLAGDRGGEAWAWRNSGVMIHAQAIEQIITESFLYRADWTQGMEFAGFFAASILLCAATLFANPRASLLFGVALARGIVWGCWWAYS